MQLKSELIELEFIDGLGNFSFLSLILSLSGSLSLSSLFSLIGLSDFLLGRAAVSMVFFAILAHSTAEAMGLSLVLVVATAFTSALGDLFRLGFLFLDGRVGSGSASSASSSSFRALVA